MQITVRSGAGQKTSLKASDPKPPKKSSKKKAKPEPAVEEQEIMQDTADEVAEEQELAASTEEVPAEEEHEGEVKNAVVHGDEVPDEVPVEELREISDTLGFKEPEIVPAKPAMSLSSKKKVKANAVEVEDIDEDDDDILDDLADVTAKSGGSFVPCFAGYLALAALTAGIGFFFYDKLGAIVEMIGGLLG